MMLARRGVEVSYESIRQWCLKFGQTYANALRRRRARPGDKWQLDEVVLKIQGKICYLWRAVGQTGVVLNILV
jgi:putative transposase